MIKLKGLRWWIIGLIGLATIINYIDRNALAVMWPDISKDLGMDKSDYANIVSIFMIAYEKILFDRRPDLVVVVGDVNSTLLKYPDMSNFGSSSIADPARPSISTLAAEILVLVSQALRHSNIMYQ